jgi:hypothetical protein
VLLFRAASSRRTISSLHSRSSRTLRFKCTDSRAPSLVVPEAPPSLSAAGTCRFHLWMNPDLQSQSTNQYLQPPCVARTSTAIVLVLSPRSRQGLPVQALMQAHWQFRVLTCCPDVCRTRQHAPRFLSDRFLRFWGVCEVMGVPRDRAAGQVQQVWGICVWVCSAHKALGFLGRAAKRTHSL